MLLYATLSLLLPLCCSLLCWFLLADSLRMVSTALCSKGGEGSALFWSRIFLILLFVCPLLVVLFVLPDVPYASLWANIRAILQAALLGVALEVLVLLRLVWKLVQRPPAPPLDARGGV